LRRRHKDGSGNLRTVMISDNLVSGMNALILLGTCVHCRGIKGRMGRCHLWQCWGHISVCWARSDLLVMAVVGVNDIGSFSDFFVFFIDDMYIIVIVVVLVGVVVAWPEDCLLQ